MRQLQASCEGELGNIALKSIATAAHVQDAHIIPGHSHARGQLLFAAGGQLQVTAGDSRWLTSNEQAVWIPPNHAHEVAATGAIAYRSLYVLPQASLKLPPRAEVVHIHALLRELIDEASTFRANYRHNSAEGRLHQVLLDQLEKVTPAHNTIALPHDRRLHAICQHVIAHPADDTPLAHWAKHCGASERTLARLFRLHTGQSYTKWRQRVRLNHALEKLKAGQSVSSISHELGYSHSTLCTLFKEAFGLAPSRYLSRPRR